MGVRVGDQFGPYLLLSKLAQGGMGEVFLARKQAVEGFRRHVVVKRMLPHLADRPDFLEMFFAEARLASRLHHPRIAAVHDAGKMGDSYFLEMEFVAGADLKAVLDRAVELGRPLPPAVVVELIAEAAEGLGYAHAAVDHDGKELKLVHRDINPANLMVSWDGELKIIDLGIAKSALAHGKTQTGMLKGKFLYMSPEQSEGQPLCGSSDLFALGLVLVEALTGRHPYDRGTLARTLAAIQADPVPLLLEPTLKPLQPVLDRCLAKAPPDRFETGEAFAEALREAATRLPQAESASEVMGRLFAEERQAIADILAVDDPERLRAIHREANPEPPLMPTLADGEERPEGWTDFFSSPPSDETTRTEPAPAATPPRKAEEPRKPEHPWAVIAMFPILALIAIAALIAGGDEAAPVASPDGGMAPVDAGPVAVVVDAGIAPKPDAGVAPAPKTDAGPRPRPDAGRRQNLALAPPKPALRLRGDGLAVSMSAARAATGTFNADADGLAISGRWRRRGDGSMTISVQARPWAIVYADDGPALGRTPPERRAVLPVAGRLRLHFKHPAFGTRTLHLSTAH